MAEYSPNPFIRYDHEEAKKIIEEAIERQLGITKEEMQRRFDAMWAKQKNIPPPAFYDPTDDGRSIRRFVSDQTSEVSSRKQTSKKLVKKPVKKTAKKISSRKKHNGKR